MISPEAFLSEAANQFIITCESGRTITKKLLKILSVTFYLINIARTKVKCKEIHLNTHSTELWYFFYISH